MWGKPKVPPTSAREAGPVAAISGIPDEFYAGKNPVIHFKNVDTDVVVGSAPQPKRVAVRPVPTATAPVPHKVFLSPRKLVIGAGILFVLFIAGASWYYWKQATKPAATKTVSTITNTEVVTTTTQVVVTTPPVNTVASTTIVTPASTTIQLPPPTVEVPPELLADSKDSDGDDVSDVAEELFRTDSTQADSDNDGYDDGHEIYNLYNPIGKEPLKIIDSGLVSEYQNPVFRYKIYQPVGWVPGNVDNDFRDVLFSTISGEYIEIKVVDKDVNETFNDWFGRQMPQENAQSYQPFESVFKEEGLRRNDFLVTFFYDQRHVFVLTYHPAATGGSINYRIVLKMMARSFRKGANSADQPMPVIESRAVPSATTSL